MMGVVIVIEKVINNKVSDEYVVITDKTAGRLSLPSSCDLQYTT